MSHTSCRKFLTQLAGATVFGFAAASCSSAKKTAATVDSSSFFEISLAEWSFHKALFAEKMTNLDFPIVAKQQYGTV